jgi:segregation and condensation protein A
MMEIQAGINKTLELMEESEPRYSLPVFEGPLDLLLYLIDKNELDIYDIPIALITEQYNKYISKMKELNLYIAADFINMAATLIHIKSQTLLPKHAKEEEAAEAADPRQVLIEQLLEHRKMVEASHILGEKEALTINQFYRRECSGGPGSLDSYDLEVWDLVRAIKDVFQRIEGKNENIILVEEKNIADKMEEIIDILKGRTTSLFSDILPRKSTKIESVLTFLAILELAKKRIVNLFQDIPFGPIRILIKKRTEKKEE